MNAQMGMLGLVKRLYKYMCNSFIVQIVVK